MKTFLNSLQQKNVHPKDIYMELHFFLPAGWQNAGIQQKKISLPWPVSLRDHIVLCLCGTEQWHCGEGGASAHSRRAHPYPYPLHRIAQAGHPPLPAVQPAKPATTFFPARSSQPHCGHPGGGRFTGIMQLAQQSWAGPKIFSGKKERKQGPNTCQNVGIFFEV